MAKDIEIIKKIEKKIGIMLNILSSEKIVSARGYTVDRNDHVIGLNLNWSRLSDISILKELKYLKILDLSDIQLEDISVLKELKSLTHLYLCRNHISDISSLKELNNLRVLHLGRNKLTDITILKYLTSLTKLYLYENQISDISFIDELINLRVLDLKNNKINKIPREILNLHMEIKWRNEVEGGIIIEGNPLESPPIEIVMKGREAIDSYFRSLEGREKALNEVKLILVGDGGAGKTSLVKCLLGKPFEMTEPQTHGIYIDHWKIKSENETIKVNIWDFGGQDIMLASHQFFLSKRSLYVLVLNSREDDKTEYWLKLIQSFGGDSPVLIVINKIDENPAFDVNRLFLKEKYLNIKGFFRVSCQEGDGIKDFSQHLVLELSKVELIRNVWGPSWFNVKKRLENMRKEMKKDFISYEEYQAICLEEKIDDEESQTTLVEFLNDLGVVLHFKDVKLKATYVVNPEWVTRAVYKIINSPEIATAKGILKLNCLENILRKGSHEDRNYPMEKYWFIIELMQKFELCYMIDEESILIPDLLEVQQPVFDFDFNGALKFQVDYDFFPRSIMPRFIVKMHKDIKESLRWRTGLILENKGFHSIAVVKADEREQKMFIYVNGNQKRDYFGVLLDTLRFINHSYDLKTIEKIPMPDEFEITISYKHLIYLEQKGRKFYEPDGSERIYSIKELLGTVDKQVYCQLLGQLKRKFSDLSKIKPQKRGLEFEKFLNSLFKIYDLNPKESFRNTGEQIDGSLQIGNETYLLEAKWHKKKIGQKDLLSFNELVSGKAMWARGIFISFSGFTDIGLKAFANGRRTSIICMDGKDIEYLLKSDLTLSQAISSKLRHAVESNEAFGRLELLRKKYPF